MNWDEEEKKDQFDGDDTSDDNDGHVKPSDDAKDDDLDDHDGEDEDFDGELENDDDDLNEDGSWGGKEVDEIEEDEY